MSYFKSRRSAVVAQKGAVATSQPLAAQAGLQMLRDGGNAIDAAVATAAVLNVVEPMSTGIGGDMFALIWDKNERKVASLNGSGRQATAANVDDVRKAGFDSIPNNLDGSHFAVSVPGTVHGWETALNQYGRMTLQEVLQPAIDYALNGYAVSEVIARSWGSAETIQKLNHRPSGKELLPGSGANGAPKYGEIITLPELGRTLQMIAEGGSEAFYKGEIAKKTAEFVQSEGGWLTEEDLANHRSDWDEAISTNYRGVDIWECPPNGQGIAALIALNLAEGFDIGSMSAQSSDRYHYLIESMRRGYADAFQYVADPRVAEVPIGPLLSKDYANRRRAGISEVQADPNVSYGDPMGGADTVYLTAVDGEGTACSFINSLFAGFGTGLVVPTLGMALQNRGSLFSFDPNHMNYLEGNKRPFQTIIPAMATKDDEMWLSFGVMGGFMQPQGHLQVASNMIDFGMDSQQALDAPRFKIDVEDTQDVMVEEDISPYVVKDLEKRGHTVHVVSGYERTNFGGGQVISRDPETGVLTAGSEPRKDGSAVGW
ncbi:MAG: gamma-glutamyltransferase [Alphaproteobacteria bacterium]|nr:gamma-glutamyltransferase [Alphaproteobacteria bacterium]|tara:strand:+ start:4186 stop:5814 length:1629 start_codon:yes stop_codon:yes gene_type:complete